MKSHDCGDPEARTWLSILEASGRSPNTVLQYSYSLRQFHEIVGKPLAEVTKAEAVAAVETMRRRWSAGGVALRLRTLRAFYRYLVAEEVISRSPLAGVSVKVPDEPQRTASDAEVDAMLAKATSRRDQALLLLLCDTGARKGEVAALEVRDINLDAGSVHYRVSKTRPVMCRSVIVVSSPSPGTSAGGAPAPVRCGTAGTPTASPPPW